jgi:hypothetical protein
VYNLKYFEVGEQLACSILRCDTFSAEAATGNRIISLPYVWQSSDAHQLCLGRGTHDECDYFVK